MKKPEAEKERVFQEHVVDVYRQIAGHFSATRYAPWPEVVWFSTLLPKGGIVLDVGCGNGRHSVFLAGEGFRVVGLDIVEELLSAAKSRARTTGVESRTEFVAGDARKLPFRDGQFDGVLCVAVLHHIPTRKGRLEVLWEMWRVLKTGGVGLVSVWSTEEERYRTTPRPEGGDSGDRLVPWTRSLDGKVFHRYYHFFTEKEFKELLAETPWKDSAVFSHAANLHAVIEKEDEKHGRFDMEKIPSEWEGWKPSKR